LSRFAQWSVMKAARDREIPVLLDGQGGDEVFLGYERYYAWFLLELIKKAKARTIASAELSARSSCVSLAVAPYAPPSKNESGVMLRMPMMAGVVRSSVVPAQSSWRRQGVKGEFIIG
ncbi:MAG TPA: hypothetical protein ENL01_04865, partial [Chlorobaculum parvum]|nr:hypothetical protein [Chlorobaculum parvum]